MCDNHINKIKDKNTNQLYSYINSLEWELKRYKTTIETISEIVISIDKLHVDGYEGARMIRNQIKDNLDD